MDKDNDYKYMVCTRCITYNQAQYIEDALNGFCMQQTSFPIVNVIIDDASTDGEPEVIKHYIEAHFKVADQEIVRYEETDDYHLIFAQHKTNINCYFAVLFLKYNHYQIKKSKMDYIKNWNENAKYIALCEGDDYWIDPLKLQKQVDFMEAHTEHSLCFCAYRQLYPNGETKDVFRYEVDKEVCPMQDIILGGGGYMATNSMLYRASMYVPYSTWAVGCPIGDLPLMLSLAAGGEVGYLSEVMCTYRIAADGSWSVRMRSNIKRRRQHHKAIIKMWRQFDEWSGRKYHRVVVKKIRKNQKSQKRDEISYLINKIMRK